MTELDTRVEVIPGEALLERLLDHVPAPAVVSVTCLPHHGPVQTVETAVRLAGAGYTVIPHLAARSVGSRRELAGHVRRLQDAGITDTFVIGGDAGRTAGPYTWSGALMEDLADLTGGTMRLGIAVYPEGHAGMPGDELLRTLWAKQELASWCVTQLCFSPEILAAFPDRLRRDGVTLPVWAGIPGPVRVSRLVKLAGTIGVGQSVGFLKRSAGGSNTGSVVRQLLSSTSYDPSPLLGAIDGAGYAGVHLYSFNDLAGLADSGLAGRTG